MCKLRHVAVATLICQEPRLGRHPAASVEWAQVRGRASLRLQPRWPVPATGSWSPSSGPSPAPLRAAQGASASHGDQPCLLLAKGRVVGCGGEAAGGRSARRAAVRVGCIWGFRRERGEGAEAAGWRAAPSRLLEAGPAARNPGSAPDAGHNLWSSGHGDRGAAAGQAQGASGRGGAHGAPAGREGPAAARFRGGTGCGRRAPPGRRTRGLDRG